MIIPSFFCCKTNRKTNLSIPIMIEFKFFKYHYLTNKYKIKDQNTHISIYLIIIIFNKLGTILFIFKTHFFFLMNI